MELNAKGALKSDDSTPTTYTKISPATSPAESTLPIIHTPVMGSESEIENFPEDAIVIRKGEEEEQSINSENIESLGLETMSLTSSSSQQQTSHRNQESQQAKCKSLFPFPADVTQSILEMFSPADIQNFALSSKASCITALPMLVRCVTLPLSDDKTGLGKILGVNHLIIKKSSPYVSDAVLGSILLFIVEQNVLEELSIDFAFSEQIAGVKAFKERFRQCWLTVHEGAFHSKQRQLTTLNIRIINPNLEYDGLNECQEFWITIMRTVQKLRIDLRDVPVPEYASDRSLIWTNYLQMVSSCGVNGIEVVFDENVSRHYTEIGSQFPNIERLKVGFTGHSRSRPSAELSGLGRMRFLRSVDLPWAYDTIVSDSGIVGNIYSKAKERAKEVVRAKTPTESKDEKMKLQVLKQTKAALAIQSLTSIKDITWRYVSEEDGEEVLLKLSIHWTGKEPRVTEVGFGGEE
ncbi:hypothetical protein TWF217_011262 [Orbilia oligospora]|nr:hypothetical protein TWF217_011262 [Orbilia oligospora]KAF3296305.1 hypothetical protein TWF132_010903 [Orbilia oligospora]